MASTARLDELKKKFDENPRRYFAPLANEHRKSGDLDQAISLCRAHLPQQPAHISGHIVLAQALFEAGSIDESREIFLASLGLDPENLIALRYLGDIARESEDVETARSWYTRVLEVDPRNDEIVQLVRDLDKPRPAAAPEPTIASEEALEAVDLSPVAEPVVANDDARFAPISMEDFDVGSDQPAVTSDAPRADVAEPAASEMSFDVHAAWNTESAPGGDSTLDAPELDPFDLHPLASAESLFDDGSDTAANDLFLNELSGGNAPDAGDLMADEVPDAWSASTAELPATSDARAASFEEGLYLEPPPAAPTEQTAPESDDAFVAETFVVSEEPSQAPTATGSHDAVTMKDPNADALALFADTQTAEWQPPTSDVASIAHTTDTLGLEVMEFVPPSSEATPSSILEPPSDADPLLGRTPDLTSAEQETGPAAFVTETMAELYLQQGFRNEALAVYRELLSRNPADANLRERVDQIESGSMSSLGMATLSEEVVESALKRQTGGPSRSVRSFFASLASRRAPAPPPQSSYYVADTTDAASDAPSIDQATSYVQDVAPESMSMPEPVIDAPASPESERSTLLSAAETLAQFDPFADTAELTPPSVAHTSAEVPDAWSAMPTPMSSPAVTPAAALGEPRTDDASNAPAIEPVAAVDPAPARRSLEDLFPNAPVTARTEAAAQTFATAFGRDEPQGRPTRAASNELSLDHVFRGSAESAAAPDGGFSFDQFFSDARPSGGDVAAPVVSAPDTGRSAGPSGDAHDIEQFTAWLEGLKKK